MKEIKEKTKFHVSMPLFIIGEILCVPSAIGFIFIFRACYNEVETELLVIVIVFMILSFLCVIGIAFLCCSTVEITEKGVKRSLFRFLCKKYYSWEDIKSVCIASNAINTSFVYFSDIDLKGKTLTYKMIGKHTISLIHQKGLVEIIKKYCPEDKIIDASE